MYMDGKQPERLLFLTMPHCEASMPLLAAGQLANHAKNVGLDYCVLDLNATFRQSLIKKIISLSSDNNCLGLFSQKMPSSLSPSIYWNTINTYRSCLRNASTFMPEIIFHWDGGDANEDWSRFADQWRFLEHRRQNTDWLIAYTSLWECIESFQPTVIGLSVTFGSQVLETIALADILRKRFPNIGIIVGGGVINDCIFSSNDLQGPLCDLVDIIYRGPGEPLVSALARIGFRGVQSLNKFRPDRAFFLQSIDLQDYDQEVKERRISAPSFISTDLSVYASPALVLPYRLTERCYWGKCKFCADHRYGGKIHRRNNHIESHIDEIERLAEQHSPAGVFFLDSAIPPSCMFELATGLMDRRLDFYWGTNARFEEQLLQPGFLERLFRGGCRFLRFGLESGSQKILNLMCKGTNVTCAAHILSRCRDVGILTHAYVMVGFPGEGKDDRLLTADFLMAEGGHPDSFNISKFVLYLESPLGQQICNPFKNKDNLGWLTANELLVDPVLDVFIEDISRTFTNAYGPARVLASPAHTIALYDKTAEWKKCTINQGVRM